MCNSQLDNVSVEYEVHPDLLHVTAWRGTNVLLSPVSRMFLSSQKRAPQHILTEYDITGCDIKEIEG
jgi:hypothetical protein